MVFAGKRFGAEGKFQMACEYCEGDRNMPAATSSYTGEAADEIITIDRADEWGDLYKNIIETWTGERNQNRLPTVRSAGESCR